MKILFYDMGSYTYRDTIQTLIQLGHTCKTIYYHFPNKYEDAFFCDRFSKLLNSSSYDIVMSINFFPLVAVLCHEHQIPYISWCYDSPLEEQLEDYFHYDTNQIYLFDRIEVAQYNQKGYSQVHHLPLAVNTERLDKLTFSDSLIQKHTCDISFVGHLYESPLEILLYSADDYTKGYIEGILQAQLRVYGYYFIDELLTDEILSSINESFRKIGQDKLSLNHKGLSYAIASEITHLERYFLLEQMGNLFRTHFYSTKEYSFDSKTVSMGPVKYFEEMPCVFRSSKLNLNPTLRSIQSGIPLRALDIMGAGGVLLSNYQEELAEHFQEGVDIIMYGNMEEAIDKSAFYIKNDTLLRKIALSGHEKVKKNFTYSSRVIKMLENVNL